MTPRPVTAAYAELHRHAVGQLGEAAADASLAELLEVGPPTGPAAARFVLVALDHDRSGRLVDPSLELAARQLLDRLSARGCAGGVDVLMLQPPPDDPAAHRGEQP